jgi:transcriptional regulator with XRE-family HTH domain
MTEVAIASATDPAPPAPRDLGVQPELGRRLRSTRLEHNLSLSDVAERTGISASFLSLVENGKSDITIGRLTRLVECYGLSITDLIPPPTPAQAFVVRASEAALLHSAAEGIDFFLLVPNVKRTMMPMLVEIQPGASLAEYGRHPGEEFVHVIEGELTLDLEGVEPRVLAPGDSAYYDAQHPHLFRNEDPKRMLRLICVDSPPPL